MRALIIEKREELNKIKIRTRKLKEKRKENIIKNNTNLNKKIVDEEVNFKVNNLKDKNENLKNMPEQNLNLYEKQKNFIEENYSAKNKTQNEDTLSAERRKTSVVQSPLSIYYNKIRILQKNNQIKKEEF